MEQARGAGSPLVGPVTVSVVDIFLQPFLLWSDRASSGHQGGPAAPMDAAWDPGLFILPAVP